MRMRDVIGKCLVVVLILGVAAGARADLTLNAVDDGTYGYSFFVPFAPPGPVQVSNYTFEDTSSTLSASLTPTGSFAAGDVQSVGLVFNVSSIPAGETIQSATLSLFASSTDGNPINVLSESYNQNTLPTASLPFGPSPSGGIYAKPTAGLNSFDVTSLLTSNTSPDVLFDVMIDGAFFSGNTAFNGRLSAQDEPTLTITFAPTVTTPEPSTLTLAGIGGLIGVVVVGRRRLGKRPD
jgi:PEP-CTERM motif